MINFWVSGLLRFFALFLFEVVSLERACVRQCASVCVCVRASVRVPFDLELG